jgi:hypothetical protein
VSDREPAVYKIICVGGTGQMVLHYYLQLYLLGIVQHPFEVVVVDTDEIIGSVSSVNKLFDDLQYGPGGGQSLGAQVPVIQTVKISAQMAATPLEALTGRKDADPHPVQAFFNRETLEQPLKHGLFARPALSSVITQDPLHSTALRPRANSTLVIVGSILGGTGGGLTAPIIDTIRTRIKREGIARVQMRAVLFSEYFTPDDKIIGGSLVRFKSNQALVMRSIREALEDVHSFHIVGGPGSNTALKRAPQEEKKGEHLAWPDDEANPFWQGAKALEHLLTETTKDRQVEFEEREVDDQFQSPILLPRAQLRLKQGLHVAENLVGKEVVLRMAADPWVRYIWGDGLANLIAHFWSIDVSRQGSKRRVRDFPRQLQRSLEAVWRGEGEEPGLRTLFPRLTEDYKVSPASIRRIPWPEVSEERRDEKLFDGTGKAARKCAATLLYWALRKGI